MKKLTWLVGSLLLVFLTLIAWLCFFQFPSMDDYVGTYLAKTFGLGGAIQWYLRELNGRFTSIPAFLTISSSRALLGQYGLLLLSLLVIAFICLFFFVRIISRHLFESVLKGWQVTGISAMILLVFLNTVPEVSSFIYWMATSVTYLLPFTFFLLLIGAYSCLFQAQPKRRWGWAVLVGLVTCLLGGCNEVMLFYACALPFLIGFIILVSGKRVPRQLIAIAGLAVLLLLAVMQIPGNGARADHFVQKQSLILSVAGAIYRTWQTLLCLFSSPLFYLSCLGVLIAAGYLKKAVVEYFASKKTHWLVDTACVVGMIFGFDVVIRQVGSEVLPPRAINIIVCLSVVSCWWIILVNAARMRPLISALYGHRQLVWPAFALVGCLALVGSGFSWQLMKNLVTAPIHVAVMKQREALIRQEKARGKNLVIMQPYQEEAALVIKEKYKRKSGFVQEEFLLPPSFSYFKDEPNQLKYAYFYAEYYGIDTIVGAAGKLVRWGLLDDSRNKFTEKYLPQR